MYGKKVIRMCRKSLRWKGDSRAECDLVKEKARELKRLLVPGMEMCNEELEHLVEEIEDYNKSMKVAEKQMKSSTSAFMAAYATTLKVLGEARKVQYGQRFHSKVSTDMKCMFCTMVLWVFLTHVANFCMTM